MRKHAARSISMAVILGLIGLGSLVPGASAGTQSTYLVLYRKNDAPASVSQDVSRAGGTLVAAYDEIGVAVVRSTSSSFESNLERDARIDGVASTKGFGINVDGVADDDEDAEESQPGDLANAPASDSDNLSGLQWDMRQIFTPEAHAITGGSSDVVVGDIDTGLDKDHPDLAGNIDFSKSVSCESGAPDQTPAAWDDHAGHGTHTAGTIAAASNGIGIVGVAPNVRIAGIKSSNDDGFFFPEMVVCSFMWVATHGIDVTNNSYFADPYLYNCRNDAEQRVLWKAEQRAIRYAMQQGVTVVASEGNQSDDLSHPEVDVISPDDPPDSEQEREISNACVVVPVEVSGVIGVTANGHNEQTDDEPGPDYLKSYYSSYGVSTADLVAPGGDSRFGINAEATNGRVLSTWPAEVPCARQVVDAGALYCYAQGTSMSGPHVAGVAALVISMFGQSHNPQNGHMAPSKVEAFLQQTADAQPCPSEIPPPPAYPTRPHLASETGEPQQCQGGTGHNSWYGAGQVNALRAVTHDTGA